MESLDNKIKKETFDHKNTILYKSLLDKAQVGYENFQVNLDKHLHPISTS